MTREPNWWPKLRRAAEAQGLSAASALAVAEILHDDSCARLKGSGVCDCDPDIKLASRSVEEGG